jgi:hypothetical protein
VIYFFNWECYDVGTVMSDSEMNAFISLCEILFVFYHWEISVFHI